jgi:hypothetical protein
MRVKETRWKGKTKPSVHSCFSRQRSRLDDDDRHGKRHIVSTTSYVGWQHSACSQAFGAWPLVGYEHSVEPWWRNDKEWNVYA